MTDGPKPKQSGMAEFSFQLIEPRCRGVLINSLKNAQSLRSKWSLGVMNSHGGTDVGGTMQRMPEIPGLTCIVVPKSKSMKVVDPLKTNSVLLERINSVIAEVSAIAPAGGRSFRCVDDQEFKFDDNGFKTLLIELDYFNSPDCDIKLEMVNGSFPTLAQIEKMDGRQLFDPRSNSRIQPKFADQYDDWQERLVFNN